MIPGNPISSEIFSKMQEGTPLLSYKKTILGQVGVHVLNPFTGQPEDRILKGDPKTNDDGCIVDLWSNAEVIYFQRANKRHFETGNLIEHKRSTFTPEKSVNEITDEEIVAILNSRFFSLQNKINEFTSPAPVHRFLNIAKEMEKSEKIIKAIEARLSELE